MCSLRQPYIDSRDKVPGRAGRLNTTKMAITFILVLLMGLVLADSACAFQMRRASRHRPSTTLHVLPFGESKAEPQLPKDVKDAISKCRGAVQKGLEVSVLDLRVSLAHCSYFCADTRITHTTHTHKDRLSRMDIEMPGEGVGFEGSDCQFITSPQL